MPIFGKKTAENIGKAFEVIDKAVPNTQESKELKAELIKEEIKSEDVFVKRARSTISYFGLFVVFLELFGVRLLIVSKISPEALEMSNEILKYFLMIWASVTGIYSVGRSFAEKKGSKLWKR